MLITVAAKSKYGVLDSNSNQWFNGSKVVPITTLEKGLSYKIETADRTGKDGKMYKDIVKAEKVDAPKVEKPVAKPDYKGNSNSGGRDFNKEAEGKTRCSMYEAALASPIVAHYCMSVESLTEALKLVEKVADEGFKYVFPEKK